MASVFLDPKVEDRQKVLECFKEGSYDKLQAWPVLREKWQPLCQFAVLANTNFAGLTANSLCAAFKLLSQANIAAAEIPHVLVRQLFDQWSKLEGHHDDGPLKRCFEDYAALRFGFPPRRENFDEGVKVDVEALKLCRELWKTWSSNCGTRNTEQQIKSMAWLQARAVEAQEEEHKEKERAEKEKAAAKEEEREKKEKEKEKREKEKKEKEEKEKKEKEDKEKRQKEKKEQEEKEKEEKKKKEEEEKQKEEQQEKKEKKEKNETKKKGKDEKVTDRDDVALMDLFPVEKMAAKTPKEKEKKETEADKAAFTVGEHAILLSRRHKDFYNDKRCQIVKINETKDGCKVKILEGPKVNEEKKVLFTSLKRPASKMASLAATSAGASTSSQGAVSTDPDTPPQKKGMVGRERLMQLFGQASDLD